MDESNSSPEVENAGIRKQLDSLLEVVSRQEQELAECRSALLVLQSKGHHEDDPLCSITLAHFATVVSLLHADRPLMLKIRSYEEYHPSAVFPIAIGILLMWQRSDGLLISEVNRVLRGRLGLSEELGGYLSAILHAADLIEQVPKDDPSSPRRFRWRPSRRVREALG